LENKNVSYLDLLNSYVVKIMSQIIVIGLSYTQRPGNML